MNQCGSACCDAPEVSEAFATVGSENDEEGEWEGDVPVHGQGGAQGRVEGVKRTREVWQLW